MFLLVSRSFAFQHLLCLVVVRANEQNKRDDKNINTRRQKVTQSMGGRWSIVPLPSSFDTIHPIDLIFGTCNEFSLYFQLIETTWYLIGFHDNHNHINDVTSGRHLEFSNFQFFSYSN